MNDTNSSLQLKQDASTAITINNIGSQSVNYANTANHSTYSSHLTDGQYGQTSTIAGGSEGSFKSVAANWMTFGKLVILEYSVNRISSGTETIFCISGVPLYNGKKEIEWHCHKNGNTVKGYIEGYNISFYANESSTAGYYHGHVVYVQ